MAKQGVWRCVECGAVLGVLDGDQVTICHAHREVIAVLPVAQRCHRCGAYNARGALRVQAISEVFADAQDVEVDEEKAACSQATG